MCVHMLGVLLGRGPGQLGLATTFTSFLSLLLAATVALVGTGTIARAPRAACIAARPITLHALARAEPYSWLTLTSRVYIYMYVYLISVRSWNFQDGGSLKASFLAKNQHATKEKSLKKSYK